MWLQRASYNAPFFTTWFITNFTILFFPLYLVCRLMTARCVSWGEVLGECVRGFRDKGFTPGAPFGLYRLIWQVYFRKSNLSFAVQRAS